jgi:hypothetical protein
MFELQDTAAACDRNLASRHMQSRSKLPNGLWREISNFAIESLEKLLAPQQTKNQISKNMSPNMVSSSSKKKCGILGATGTGSQLKLSMLTIVGQRFIALIGDSHPLFTIHALGASPRSAGKLYTDAVNWKLADDIPAAVNQLPVRTCEPTGPFLECDVVFSGLDADVAGEIGISH